MLTGSTCFQFLIAVIVCQLTFEARRILTFIVHVYCNYWEYENCKVFLLPQESIAQTATIIDPRTHQLRGFIFFRRDINPPVFIVSITLIRSV